MAKVIFLPAPRARTLADVMTVVNCVVVERDRKPQSTKLKRHTMMRKLITCFFFDKKG